MNRKTQGAAGLLSPATPLLSDVVRLQARFKASRPVAAALAGAPAEASQRRRIGFSTKIARMAVKKFIAMTSSNTGIHDPVDLCSRAASGPPTTEAKPNAKSRKP